MKAFPLKMDFRKSGITELRKKKYGIPECWAIPNQSPIDPEAVPKLT